jgi:threonylcarbamoyladenosine tRNA methylthiotransferase MtaB
MTHERRLPALDRPLAPPAATAPAGGRYHVVTLGCKLNQFDTASAEGVLRAGAMTPTDEPAAADVIILNTCTVTGRADAEGRRLARRLRRLNPGARIVATGCYAERDPDALRRTGAFDDVVGLRERERLPAALLGALADADACAAGSAVALSFGDRARAWLRVQEGCDLACSYCVIPRVRGPGRSVPVPQALAELRRFRDGGIVEVGLTGVNTGSWGQDLSPRQELADLLEAILAADLGLRIRLNSLEPRTVTDRVLDLLRAAPETLLPHVQVPLQSGCDRILGRMARNYRTGFYRDLVLRAAERVPDLCLGADVITGFPGETVEDFEQTVRFVSGLPLAYLHVFSYSARPGTRAAGLEEAVAPHVIKERTTRLRGVGLAQGRAFRRRLLGRTLPGLALHAWADDGATRVLTGNYVEVLVPRARAGEVVPVELTALDEGLLVRGRLAA